MTYEEKSEIVIRQLREDRDRLLDAMDKIRAEIEAQKVEEEPHLCDYRHYRNEGIDMALEVIDKYREEQTDAT